MRTLLVMAMLLAGAAAAQPVQLLTAGSLRAAMLDLLQVYGQPVALTTGPSGTLRERIAAGTPADVFASANMAHPAALAAAANRPHVLFARNRLCALARPGLEVTGATLLDRMLDAAVRLGTSTPVADPSGDYAWALFARAEAVRPGARATLEAKALQLVGGPNSPPPPADRSAYSALMQAGAADLFLSYCTNAAVVVREVPGARIVEIPPALAVGADYGLVVLSDRPEAARLALFILSPPGQTILARHGFEAPTRPME